jgi:hypothetical protein
MWPVLGMGTALRLQRACSCAGTCSQCSGSHPELQIGAAHDGYEEEAERVASAIGTVGRVDAPLRLARVPASGNATSGLQAPPMVHQALQTPGETLNPGVRAGMEARFGHDFSRVRVHADAIAAESAESVSSLAYTVGSHIVFAPGRYAPGTGSGQRLLVHELAHVVQQSEAAPLLQRQPDETKKPRKPLIPIPVFDQLDPCGTLPVFGGSTICGSDIQKARDILSGGGSQPKAPACSEFGAMEPGRGEFAGLCCPKVAVQTAEKCCIKQQVNPRSETCCPAGTHVEGSDCKKDDLTPIRELCLSDAYRTSTGKCCFPFKPDPLGLTCQVPPAAPPPAPVPTATAVGGMVVGFFQDMPQNESVSFAASVTPTGKKKFNGLVAALVATPGAQVQLAGNASSEKPASDPDYNSRLTDRRVALIAAELGKSKIDASRIADPPGGAALAGCTEVATGEWSCGDSAAGSEKNADDRNVTALVFTVTTPSSGASGTP